MKFDEAEQEGRKQMGSGEWYNLEVGKNKCRIVSEPELIAKHFDQTLKKSFVCFGKEKGCEYCKKGDKPGIKYLLYVVDRNDEEVKIARFPYTVVKILSDLQNDEEHKFKSIPDYDITVVKKQTGDKPRDVEYSVIAARENTELTDKEKEVILDKKPISEIIENMKKKEMEGVKQDDEIDVEKIDLD